MPLSDLDLELHRFIPTQIPLQPKVPLICLFCHFLPVSGGGADLERVGEVLKTVFFFLVTDIVVIYIR